jgi:signal transduction histidine kinase
MASGTGCPCRGDAEITNWFWDLYRDRNQKQAESVNLQREKLLGIGRLAAGVAHDFNNLLMVILCGASNAMESLPPAHHAQETLQGVVQAGERAAELTGKMLAYAGKGNQYREPIDLNKLVNAACDSLRASLRKRFRSRSAERDYTVTTIPADASGHCGPGENAGSNPRRRRDDFGADRNHRTGWGSWARSQQEVRGAGWDTGCG